MNKFLIALFLLVVIFTTGNAQDAPQLNKKTASDIRAVKRNPQSSSSLEASFRRCSAMEADATLRAKYPSLPKKDVMERELQKRITNYKKTVASSRTTADEVYVIPVIVHIIHNGQNPGDGPNITAAQVQSQIDVLNEDFRRKKGTPGFNNNPVGADVQIEFALAVIDPQGRTLAEPGVHRHNGGRATWDSFEDIETVLKPNTIWDPTKYLNMWTVTYGGELEDNLGYAQFPVLSGLDGLDDRTAGLANTDGLVMRHSAFGKIGSVIAPYNKGRTTTHEIGHWLGLRHIWGDMEDCEGSDYCNDTPVAASPNYRCIAGTNTCTQFTGNDMIENYMDYTNDECMNIFTLDQRNRMRTVMLNSPRRKELINSKVHISDNTNKPFAAFSANNTKTCTGTTITFTDESTNTPTSWSWVVLEGETELTTSTLKNPAFTFNSEGVYSIRLTVTNASGSHTTEKSNYITILSSTNTTLPFSETFEPRGLPVGWSQSNPDADREWEWVEVPNMNGVGVNCLYFDNYDAETDPTGTTDAIISSKLNLSTNLNAELSFDVAYAQYEDEDGVYFDSLVLYYSTDCGQTFKPFWKKWGEDLATGLTSDESFIPTTSEWRKEKISLTFLNGQSSVQIAIANVSGWGNNLFLDNIRIEIPVPTVAPVSAFSTSTRSVCPGSSIKFTDNSTNIPQKWTWTFPGGTPATSNEQSPTVVYNTPGTYAVTLRTENTKGNNTKTETNYITVTSKANITITSNKLNICQGDSIQLTASGGVEQKYIWKDKVRGKIGEGSSILVKPGTTSTYIVEGQNASGCSGSASYEVVVNTTPDKPVITITDLSATAFTLSSSVTTNIQWLLNGQPINGATQPTLEVSTSGLYSVRTTVNGCSSVSDPTSITGTEHEIDAVKLVTIYPNPTDHKVTVTVKPKAPIKSSKVILYNSLGVALDEKSLIWDNQIWKADFDLGRFSRGNYLIRVEYPGNQVKKSFIKN